MTRCSEFDVEAFGVAEEIAAKHCSGSLVKKIRLRTDIYNAICATKERNGALAKEGTGR